MWFWNLIGSDTTSRLKQLGMEFTVWVFKHVRTSRFSGSLVFALKTFFWGGMLKKALLNSCKYDVCFQYRVTGQQVSFMVVVNMYFLI